MADEVDGVSPKEEERERLSVGAFAIVVLVAVLWFLPFAALVYYASHVAAFIFTDVHGVGQAFAACYTFALMLLAYPIVLLLPSASESVGAFLLFQHPILGMISIFIASVLSWKFLFNLLAWYFGMRRFGRWR